MKKSTYKDELKKLRIDIDSRLMEVNDISSEIYKTLITCKANIKNFLPEYNVKDATQFFKDVLYYRDWAELDQRASFAFENIKTEGSIEALDLAAQNPRIFCTFHLGSYRMINYLLVNNNIDVTLVVSDTIYENVSKEFDFMHQNYIQKKQLSTNFKVLNAEKGNVGLQMIKDLKRGRSLLIYIDGNTGVDVGKNDDKLVEIDFLNQRILARKGVAFLSYLLNVPIVPVVAYREEKSLAPIVNFLPTINPDKQIERELYCKVTTQFLFDRFADYLRKYPEQWEAWQYVNRFLPELDFKGDNRPVTTDKIYSFNGERFSLFSKESEIYLFDTKTYNSFKVSKPLSALLTKVGEIKATGEEWGSVFNSKLFQNFVSNRIFT